MGDVWLATEVRLGRKVALKLLPADVTRDACRVLRFEQEARAGSTAPLDASGTTRSALAEPSVAGNRMTLPIAEATGSVWMLDNLDK